MSWRKIRQKVLKRDHNTCHYCGGSANQVDHIIPRKQGGSNELSNLVAACSSCNASKNDRTPKEWEEYKNPPKSEFVMVLRLDNGREMHLRNTS